VAGRWDAFRDSSRKVQSRVETEIKTPQALDGPYRSRRDLRTKPAGRCGIGLSRGPRLKNIALPFYRHLTIISTATTRSLFGFLSRGRWRTYRDHSSTYAKRQYYPHNIQPQVFNLFVGPGLITSLSRGTWVCFRSRSTPSSTLQRCIIHVPSLH
jgi:hypothetical protein